MRRADDRRIGDRTDLVRTFRKQLMRVRPFRTGCATAPMRPRREEGILVAMSPSETAVAESVFAELAWESRLADAGIRVLVVEDVVVLLGQVSSYEQKCAAARAALRADGVLFVHNRLEVVLEPEKRVSDSALQHAAVQALRREPQVPNGLIKVEVRNGRVTLSGPVALPMQVDAALAAVRRVAGLRDLRNELRMRGRPAGPAF